MPETIDAETQSNFDSLDRLQSVLEGMTIDAVGMLDPDKRAETGNLVIRFINGSYLTITGIENIRYEPSAEWS